MLSLLLLAACWSTGDTCIQPVDQADRSCETDEDCQLVHVDCAKSCTCNAVNSSVAESYEAAMAEGCGERGCDQEACLTDCFDSQIAVCQSQTCRVFERGDDTAFAESQP